MAGESLKGVERLGICHLGKAVESAEYAEACGKGQPE